MDILQEFADGSRRWIEASADVFGARARVRELAMRAPGVYVIFNQHTQQMVPMVDGRKEVAGATWAAANR